MALCDQIPELKSFGIFRKLNDGKEEYVPYCSEHIGSYISFNERKFNEILERLNLPEEGQVSGN